MVLMINAATMVPSWPSLPPSSRARTVVEIAPSFLALVLLLIVAPLPLAPSRIPLGLSSIIIQTPSTVPTAALTNTLMAQMLVQSSPCLSLSL